MKLSLESIAQVLLTILSLFFLVAGQQQQSLNLRNKLVDKCCQVGRERAAESSKFNCKMSAREALVETSSNSRANLLALSAETLLVKEASFADQCELVLESCCMAFHRNKNCEAGKQFAKSGAFCMDVELSKEASLATESFNDCCMACSLGVLAARNSNQTETSDQSPNSRCKLLSPLASSLSGQLYEGTYVECCQENLPRVSSALLEPGSPIDCVQSNPCSQRCIPANRRTERDRCECFVGYKLAADGISCLDVDECKLNLHSCRKEEICDNTAGSFRCMARSSLTNEESLTNQPDETNSFSPLRLCPVGFRWNSQDGRCIQRQQAQQHFSSSESRSASLMMRSRSSSGPIPVPVATSEWRK